MAEKAAAEKEAQEVEAQQQQDLQKFNNDINDFNKVSLLKSKIFISLPY